MYLLLGIVVIVIGVLLFFAAGRIARGNKTVLLCLRIAGIVLLLFGIAALALVLTGKLVLPLG